MIQFNKNIFITKLIIALSIFLALPMDGKRAIIIGASSGMGREVAKLLANEGYTLGLAGRQLVVTGGE